MVALLCATMLPAGAARAGEVLATEQGPTEVAAGAGHVVWSSRDPTTRLFHLVDRHAGQTTTLPVAPEPQLFDAAVGTTAGGRPMVVFTRCRHYSAPFDTNGAGLPPLEQQRSCALRRLVLGAPHDEAVDARRPAGASDVRPAVDRGRILFFRVTAPSRSSSARLMTLSPGGRLGARTAGPPSALGSGGERYEPNGGPLALAAAGGRTAFAWLRNHRPSATCRYGEEDPDPLQVSVFAGPTAASGPRTLAATCVPTRGLALDGTVALSATAAWWSASPGSGDGPLLVIRRDLRTGALTQATVPADPGLGGRGSILALAWDGAALVYAHDANGTTRVVRAPDLVFAPR